MHLIYTLQQYTLYIITVYIIYYNNIHIITLYKKIQIYTSNKNLNKHYKLKLANHATATQYINHYHCSVAAYVVTQMNQTPTHKIHPVQFISQIQHIFCNQNQMSTTFEFKKCKMQ